MKSKLIVFAKSPIRERVKTRLARDIGIEEAFSFYIQMLDQTVYLAIQWQEISKSHEVVWYWDSLEGQELYPLPNSFAIQKQIKDENLGKKMEKAFQEVFQESQTPIKVCIIGVDCPYLTIGILEEGFQKLESSQIVVGPAEDGGYYLLGMKKLEDVFDEIPWSTSLVFPKTMEKIQSQNLQYSLLPVLRDIDTKEDYIQWKKRNQSVVTLRSDFVNKSGTGTPSPPR